MINDFFTLLQKTNNNSIKCFDTFFYISLQNKHDLKWVKIENVKQALIPINIRNLHWVLVIVHFEKKQIEYFDSKLSGNYGNPDKIMKDIGNFFNQKTKINFNIKINTNCPQQRNGSDCGIYICLYAFYIINQWDFSSLNNASSYYYRVKILNSLYHKSLPQQF